MTTQRNRTMTPTLTPYLAVADARAALEWYARVLGAVARGEPYEQEDGRIGHAEMMIGESVLMLADEDPEVGMLSPARRGGSSVAVHVLIEDVDEVMRRADVHGGHPIGEVQDNPYGRMGRFDDPFGHRWLVRTPPGEVDVPEQVSMSSGPAHGDTAYITVLTPDDERARAFYGEVLGWTCTPGGGPRQWQVERTNPMAGISGGQDADVQLCFQVDDVDAACTRVREFGGEAGTPEDKPYGRLAFCVDNQGKRFHLVESGAA